MKQPLVSVIVPTRNSAEFLTACLQSIANQTYKNIELIVVDNHSTDSTQQIATKFTDHFFTRGPERSAQRNFAVTKATGEYVAIIDSDMELTPKVIEACVDTATSKPALAGIIIPEESFGEGFWAQCKRLERSFYVGVDWIEAARFFPRAVYARLGGFDESLVAGEDWDLSKRASKIGVILRVTAVICHNEGQLKLMRVLKKRYYYAAHAKTYLKKHPESLMPSTPTGPLNRYRLFFSRPAKLFKDPQVGVGVLFMKTCEYGFGALGFALGSLNRHGTKVGKETNG